MSGPFDERELIVEQLAADDGDSPVADSADDGEKTTVSQLRAELETLASRLRTPAPTDEYVDESGCRRAIEIVQAIGKEPSFATGGRGSEADVAAPLAMTELGQYRLMARLGQGGMGTVYKALHTKLDKVVALKVLPADAMQNSGAVARFEREMRAVGKLRHPNIVAAHDAGEIDGTHYLVMELVEGEDLTALVRRLGPLPVPEACELIRQAALGLQHAHEHGLVHRDIKPSNLMLAHGEGGRVKGQETDATTPLTLSPQPLALKILDMGLALLDEGHVEAPGELTSTGQIMGTLDYMAPEQGSDTHNVDIRADVYSLGATLYKLLTGRAPFESKRYNTPIKKLTALANTEPERVDAIREDVPSELADLVQRMLSKSPADRPTPPLDVARLLAPFAASPDLNALIARRTDLQSVRDGFQTRPTIDEEDHTTDPTCIAETNVEQRDVRSGSPDPAGAPTAGLQPPSGRPAVAAVVRSGDRATTEMRATTGTSPVFSKNRVSGMRLLGGFAAVVLLGVILFKFATRDGTLYVELDNEQPVQRIEVDGHEVTWTPAGSPTRFKFDVSPGERTVRVFLEDGTELVTEATEQPIEIAAGSEQTIRAWLEPRAVADSDADRRIAEHMLHHRSSISVNVDGELRQIAKLTELPREPFQVHSIWLQSATMSDEELALFNELEHLTSLRLNLSGSPISDAGLALFDSWTSLTELSLNDTQITDAGLEHLQEARELGTLNLCNLPVTDTGLAHLEGLRWLTLLRLAGTDITDAGLGHIRSNLYFLNLQDTNTGDAGLAHLGRMSNMQTLVLDRTQVSDAGLMHLENLKLLGSVGLTGTNVTAAGVARLHRALPNCTIVWDGGRVEPGRASPESSNFALQFDGEDDRVDIPSLVVERDSPITIEIDVIPTAAPVGGEGTIVSLGVALKVGDQQYGNNPPIWHVSGFGDADVFSVVSDGPEFVLQKPTRIAAVYSNEHLSLFVDGHKLNTQTTAFRDGKVSPVTGPVMLRDWQAGAFFGVTSDRHLLEQPQNLYPFQGIIRQIRISTTSRFESDYEPRQRLEPDEHTLALYHFDEGEGDVLHDATGHGHDGTIHGATWVKQVGPETWAPYDADRRAAEWVLSQRGQVTIEREGAQVEVTDTADLPSEAFSVIRFQKTAPNAIDADLQCLAGLTHLTFAVLGLKGSKVTDAGLAVLRETNSKLWCLQLSDTDIGDGGLEHLGQVARLRELSLSRTGITDSGLAHLEGLRWLDLLRLNRTRITDAGLAHIKSNPSFLSLNDTKIGDASMAHVARMSHLRTLILQRTQVSDVGLGQLKNLKRLAGVDLLGTKVTAAGVAELHEALPNCRIIWDGGTVEPASGSSDAHNFALQFDGEDDYVVVEGIHIDGESPWTVEGHVEFPEGASGHLMSYGRGIRVRRSDFVTVTFGTETISMQHAGSWPRSHLAIVYDGKQLQMYVDGQLTAGRAVTGVDFPATEPPSIEFVLGALARWTAQSPGSPCACQIDEVRISNTARYIDDKFQPEPRFEPDDDTLALYHFDEGEGDVLHDASRNGNDGTIHGAMWVKQVGPETWVPYDADRRAAEAVIALGGSLNIRGPGVVQSIEMLPEEAFQIESIFLKGAIVSDPAELAAVQDLARLTMLSCQGVDAPPEAFSQLRNLPELTRANFYGSNIDDAGVAALASSAPHLSQLALTNTKISDEALSHIARLEHLEDLDLAGCSGITDGGIRALSTLRQLNDLNLSGVNKVSRGLESLAGQAPLETLSVAHTSLTDQDFDIIAGFPTLRSVVLSPEQFTQDSVAHLSTLNQLDSLSIYGAERCDLKDLEKLPQLKKLLLRFLPLQDKDLTHVAALGQLETLRLLTGVSDAALEHLHEMTSLRHVDLVESPSLTEDGVRKLSAALPECEIVSPFGTFGPETSAIYDVDRRAAEAVISAGGSIGVPWPGPGTVDSLDQLPEEAFHIAWINMNHAVIRDPDQLAVIQDLVRLEALYCERVDSPPEAFHHFGNLPELFRARFDGTTIDDSGVAAIASAAPSLTELVLGGTTIGDEALRHVARLENLEVLVLENCRAITDDGISALRSLPQLKYLQLAGATNVSRGLGSLAGHVPLETLIVPQTSLSDQDFDVVARFPILRGVGLAPEQFTAVSASHLATLNELDSLSFHGDEHCALEHLEKLPRLKTLSLRFVPLPDEDLAHVAALRQLETLRLPTEVSDAGLEHLHEMTSLRYLELAESPSLTEDGVRKLSAALPECEIVSPFGTFGPETPPPAAADAAWTPTSEEQVFFDEVAAMAPEEQIEAVRAKLVELNPEFDVDVEHEIDEGRIASLNLRDRELPEIWPVAALRHLGSLDFSYSRVADLSPLRGLPLNTLICRNTLVSDLSPLVGMPLTALVIGNTRVSDLEPLKGMQLTTLNCASTPVSDLSPLSGIPLTTLECQSTLVSDLSPLEGMPLTRLGYDVRLLHTGDEELLRKLPLQLINGKKPDEFWEQIAVRREAAEQFAEQTAALSPEEQVAAVQSRLLEPNGVGGALGYDPGGDAVTSATLHVQFSDYMVSPLMAFRELRKLTIIGGHDWLDISSLNSLPIEELICPEKIAFKNAPVLRDMKTLQTINGQPKAEYLDELRAKYGAAMRNTPLPVDRPVNAADGPSPEM